MRFVEAHGLRGGRGGSGRGSRGHECWHGLQYRGIFAGKFRRYFSFRNFLDVFKVMIGFCQAVRIVRRFDPHVVFSKGGFVALPVVLGAAWVNFWRRVGVCRGRERGRERISIVIHESDVEPGLANRIAARFADKILVSFEKTLRDGVFGVRAAGGGRTMTEARVGSATRAEEGTRTVVASHIMVVGNPVRAFVLKGDRALGLRLCGFNKFKPVVLVMGGSQGARQINNLVWGNLDKLLEKWQVVHITGKGNMKFGLKKVGYKQFDLLFDELKDVYAASSVVVSRGGANSLAEIAALEKKAVIIPLGLAASRGDQIVNARVCAEEYGWQVLYGEIMGEQFLRAVELASGDKFKGAGREIKKAAGKVVDVLLEV